jgi:thioredoxin reductase (NADPH)
MENVIIAGSGPAGATAAIYAARALLNPLVLEGPAPGGQLVVSHEVENYPGFEVISGFELLDKFKNQAEKFGARFQSASVSKVKKTENSIIVTTDDGKEIETKTLIIASGAIARRLPIETEPLFYGKGVSGCATCDGAFYRNCKVLVIGGGNTAIEDALFLTRFASEVTIVHRRDYLRADPVEVEKAKAHEKINWMIPYGVKEIKGDSNGLVSGAILQNLETGEEKELECEGIFVAIGHDPQIEAFKDIVDISEEKLIVVEKGTAKTNTPGIFACGDVIDPLYKQAVVAAGTGCMAALDAQKYLESL